MTVARGVRPGGPRRKAWWLAVLAAGLGQLACQDSAPALRPQAEVAAVQPAPADKATAHTAVADRYDLERDEKRGGHTLARHVGLSDAELQARLRRERRISAASTYADRVTAERVVARALAQHRARIDEWLARQGPRPNLALDYRGTDRETIGRSLTRRGRLPDPCSNAVVVLRWDGGRAFYVLTSYPETSS